MDLAHNMLLVLYFGVGIMTALNEVLDFLFLEDRMFNAWDLECMRCTREGKDLPPAPVKHSRQRVFTVIVFYPFVWPLILIGFLFDIFRLILWDNRPWTDKSE